VGNQRTLICCKDVGVRQAETNVCEGAIYIDLLYLFEKKLYIRGIFLDSSIWQFKQQPAVMRHPRAEYTTSFTRPTKAVLGFGTGNEMMLSVLTISALLVLLQLVSKAPR